MSFAEGIVCPQASQTCCDSSSLAFLLQKCHAKKRLQKYHEGLVLFYSFIDQKPNKGNWLSFRDGKLRIKNFRHKFLLSYKKESELRNYDCQSNEFSRFCENGT